MPHANIILYWASPAPISEANLAWCWRGDINVIFEGKLAEFVSSLSQAEQVDQRSPKKNSHSAILILPGEFCLSGSQSMPPRSQKFRRQLLPNMIEEQVSIEPDNLHFAFVDSPADEDIAYVAMESAVLEGALQTLNTTCCPVVRAYTDYQLLDPIPDAINSLEVGGRHLLRHGKYSGQVAFASNLEPINRSLQLDGQSTIDPIAITPTNVTEKNSKYQFLFERAGLAHDRAESALLPIDLLQQDFSARQPRPVMLSKWVLFTLAVCLLVPIASMLGTSFHFLQKLDSEITQANERIGELLPSASTAADKKLYIESWIKKNGGVKHGFLEIFQVFFTLTKEDIESREIEIQSLTYSDSDRTLGLDVIADSVESVDKYRVKAASFDLHIDVKSIRQVGDRVSMRLEIKKNES